MIFIIIAILFLILIALKVRLRLFKLSKALGVDHWYWLLCIEDAKKRRKLPAKLPYFMLEIEEQWYPPLFPGLMALFPLDLLKKHGGRIAQWIDLLNGFIIFFSVLWLSKNIFLAFLAGFSYIIAIFPLSYNTQLQPRGLANFLLTTTMVCLWFFIETNDWKIWGLMLTFSTLILFLHKMTTQMWVIYILGFSFWAKDLRILSLLPASVLTAIIVSGGFYVKVLRAHCDIISFWHKNIKYLGSHQYYESPQYKKDGFTSTAIHQWNFQHLIRKLIRLFQYNVYIIFLPLLIYYSLTGSFNRFESFLWIWLGITYLWALLTTFFPYFIALGAGEYYLYQSFFPLFSLFALVIHNLPITSQWAFFVLWGISLFASGVFFERYKYSIANPTSIKNQNDLYEILDYLKKLPKDGVFCIPFTLPDITAYWTRKRVFWGGHGYGFKILSPYFPIMKVSLQQVLSINPLNYLLFWNKYLDSLEDVGLKVGIHLKFLISHGEYELYEVIK